MEENKILRYGFFVVGLVLVLAICWWLLSEPNVSNQRERANDVRTELGNAGTAQRDAQKHIDDAGQRIDRSLGSVDEIAGRIDEAKDRIADVQERAEPVAGILADCERRIEESQRILQGIRERAGQDGK